MSFEEQVLDPVRRQAVHEQSKGHYGALKAEKLLKRLEESALRLDA